jgi:hypothetical protein
MYALQEGAIDPAPGVVSLQERWQDRIHLTS